MTGSWSYHSLPEHVLSLRNGRDREYARRTSCVNGGYAFPPCPTFKSKTHRCKKVLFDGSTSKEDTGMDCNTQQFHHRELICDS